MAPHAPKLLFLVFFVLNCLLWSNSRFAEVPRHASSVSQYSRSILGKRDLGKFQYANGTQFINMKDQCHPISFPIQEQCANVVEHCPKPHTVLSIPYVRKYFCAKPSLRPVIFAGYVVWLLFLFSTLGISAADFFCPNLGTLSRILGLDENVAGVTFLAFGNGSPDVFATFSAMRTHSGGLAIGELLGAATFVTSCVVGSMCIIKPFKVDRVPFLRDVGFFTVAIILLLIVLWDSKLEAWESVGLVGLYLFYVSIVVVGSWWERRKERMRRLEELIRDEFREESALEVPYINEPYLDEPSPAPAAANYVRGRTVSTPNPQRQSLHLQLPARPHTRSASPNSSHLFPTSHPLSPSPHANHMPSFSLIALILPSFRRPSSSSRAHTPISFTDGGEMRDPWDAALAVGQSLPLEQRSPRHSVSEMENGRLLAPPDMETGNMPIPTISHTPASPSVASTDMSAVPYIPPTRRQRFFRTLSVIWHVLFPTLHNFRSKSFLGMIAAIFAAPAVILLTLTLPVVVTDHDNDNDHTEKLDGFSIDEFNASRGDVGRLVEFEEEGVGRERRLVAEDVIDEDEDAAVHELKFNKWLMAVQCTAGPLFCVSILFAGSEQEPWLLLAAGVAGAAVGILVAVFSQKGEHPTARLARCTMGFIVAIVWIMAIADEVVEVLQTFALIFGLSDAIIGLTIFAVGNSLADLVANMSVAVFAPIMGFSACFGGPMLNILLGIGISGTYIIRQTDQPYPLEFSTTLVITTLGLLALLITTLIFVPWNGYFLPRAWGFTLIAIYMVLMTANVIVEVMTDTA
ncbi:hypothetical protein NM688_g4631 [Phlebia brevispora]|uniref:Uncharacterized protein n=1 Tax=Phlebia brevispora TaxID=194682 RepID=A0ACC1T2J1_9APHY|nr:hypothetical protein NM688_g4631 [Phlebia brevispora]